MKRHGMFPYLEEMLPQKVQGHVVPRQKQESDLGSLGFGGSVDGGNLKNRLCFLLLLIMMMSWTWNNGGKHQNHQKNHNYEWRYPSCPPSPSTCLLLRTIWQFLLHAYSRGCNGTHTTLIPPGCLRLQYHHRGYGHHTQILPIWWWWCALPIHSAHVMAFTMTWANPRTTSHWFNLALWNSEIQISMSGMMMIVPFSFQLREVCFFVRQQQWDTYSHVHC